VNAMLPAVVATFFVLMGLVALAVPERVSSTFGIPTLTPAGRNEVRAVYGGFGVAIGALLFATAALPTHADGVRLAVAVALGGMAGGRLLAAAIERPGAFYPAWFYCGVEIAGAVALLAAPA
jgi:hypothetical protein